MQLLVIRLKMVYLLVVYALVIREQEYLLYQRRGMIPIAPQMMANGIALGLSLLMQHLLHIDGKRIPGGVSRFPRAVIGGVGHLMNIALLYGSVGQVSIKSDGVGLRVVR